MSEILKYKEYIATVNFSAEDEVFYGKIQGINDLVNFEGESVKELKKAFKESVEDYVATCKYIGKQPQKSYKGSFNIRISSDLHKEAAVTASQHKMSLNDFVKAAIDYAVKHTDEVAKAV